MTRIPALAAAVASALAVWAETVAVPGLREPADIFIDRWGVPHIYARSAADLFFAQGWMAARDRLFQIDSWRRTGIGAWAEVLGPQAIPRDRLARQVRYRGDWDAEWNSYAPDAKAIATSFTNGINAYIRSLRTRPPEFVRAGYDPALWQPEDVTARMAGLAMMRNLLREVDRAHRIRQLGLARAQELFPTDPFTPLRIPPGLDLDDITDEILAPLRAALRTGGDSDTLAGSNNWVVRGARTATGAPILANDPHRAVLVPSLRKTVHLVAPGWNVIGAGEPALPGIALGHNDDIAFGFTIAGIDQMDLFVETLNPANPDEYRYMGAWRPMEIEREKLNVRGQAPVTIELRYTVHGPVLHLDRARRRAYALRWVGAEPGSAGYLAALRLCRARNWREFFEAARYYKVPSENLVYADRAGHIGWIAAGLAPIRRGHDGLLPVPGDSQQYEWNGWLRLEQHPQAFDPFEGYIATANHNILPSGYPHPFSYEFAAPFRYQRIAEVLSGQTRHTVEDSIQLQLDVVSVAARRFAAVLQRYRPGWNGHVAQMAARLASWDCDLRAESVEASLYQTWVEHLYPLIFPAGVRPPLEVLLRALESGADRRRELSDAAEQAWHDLEKRLGANANAWTWGRLHTITFRHPLDVPAWARGPIPRPGDATTPNATGGAGFRQVNGASYRQVIDLSNWDRSVVTNTPGESGNPGSRHYADLLAPWAAGQYHPLPFSRRAVVSSSYTTINLRPARR